MGGKQSLAVLARWPNSELLLAAFDQRRLLPPKRSLARFSLSLTLTVSDQTLRHSTSIEVFAFSKAIPISTKCINCFC